MRRAFVLFLMVIVVLYVKELIPGISFTGTRADTTMILGFLIIMGLTAGPLCKKIRFPKLTGYILVGIILGPHLLGFVKSETVTDLGFINDLALTFIALAAGGELKISDLRHRLRTIIFIIIGSIVFVYMAITLFMTIAAPRFLPGIGDYSLGQVIAIASIVGILCVARSPSSTIAVINECRARGIFTETVLGVTVVIDVLVIMLFAMGLSITEIFLSPGTTFDIWFLAAFSGQILFTLFIGFLIGLGLSYYIYKVKADLTIVILMMAFLVTRLSYALNGWLEVNYDFSLRLEPLLICMAAGFTVQNFSEHGEKLINAIESVSLPVYVVFFTLVGAALNLEALRGTWMVALMIVLVRGASVYTGSYLGGRASGDREQYNRLSGLGFITQAGVSLGLATELMRRFPAWGPELATVIIAVIGINQLIGPIMLKYSLEKAGEVSEEPLGDFVSYTK
jgi:Kef-type K+ transport system membrane component KefB